MKGEKRLVRDPSLRHELVGWMESVCTPAFWKLVLVAASVKSSRSAHPFESVDACGQRCGHVPGGER